VVGYIEGALVWGCFDSIDDVILAFPNVDRIMIDIPIGLSSKNFNRTVDAKARTYLRSRKSSIFSPPCREAVYAENYRKALEINKIIIGKGISIQAYNISSKIREIDEWLKTKAPKMNIHEAHPELCFKTLNNSQDLEYSKHEKEGISMRKKVLFNKEPKLEDVFDDLMKRFKRSEVKADDVLDAMALHLINRTADLSFVEDDNTVDETGKKIGIVYM